MMIIMRMIFPLLASLFLFLLHTGYCSAGLALAGKEYYKFYYEIEGELEVKPDKTVFPVIITAHGKTYEDSLKMARKFIERIETGLKELDAKAFSSSPTDFFKPQSRRKNFSIFGNDKKYQRSKLILYVYVNFTKDQDFWERAQLVAKAHDFIDDLISQQRENDKISASLEDTYNEIDNIERYRPEIVKLIYQKARAMADIIANEEKAPLQVKHVTFGQRIKEEIINFSSASLTIDAKIEFAFSNGHSDGN